MSRRKVEIKELIRYIPLLIMIAAIAVYFVNKDSFTPESISKLAPENNVLAVMFIMALAAAKSLSVFFPFFVIEIISALLFPKTVAVAVNIAAIAVSFLISYTVGRCSGSKMIPKLRVKYPKFDVFQGIIEKNEPFSIFALRIIGIIPMDVVGMYFGAMKSRFAIYMLASLIGALPDLVLETLIGTSIKTLSSPLFFIAFGFRMIISVASFAIYRKYVAKKRGES